MNIARWSILIAITAVLSATAGYWLARSHKQGEESEQAATSTPERKALYWYDPMVPNQRFDKPGKSPFMDMQLVAKYAGEEMEQTEGIKIDATVAQNLGIRVVTVQRGVFAQPLSTVGSIVFNQRDVAIVQARTSGVVTRVYQRAPGDVIARQAPLVEMLAPEWTGAQAEFIALLKSNDAEFISAARQRLVLLGMPGELIDDIEKTRQPRTTVIITAPIAGVINSLDVRAGMSLSTGNTLAIINGIDTVWLEAQVPETQSGAVTVGETVNATLTAYAGEPFSGKVIAILPEINGATRTTRVRVELPNPQQRLRPGMFAQVRLDHVKREPVVWVPSEAVIRSGTRNIVIVATEHGHFMPVEVQLGAESDDKTIILSGLQEGQQIVASGQFLIDSEASLQGVLTRLNTAPLHGGSQP